MIPETRSEQYLASIIGEEVELPVPQSRIEHYLNIIAQNGVAPSSAGLINYDPDADYPDGSIGKEVHDLDGDVDTLKSQIADVVLTNMITSDNFRDTAYQTTIVPNVETRTLNVSGYKSTANTETFYTTKRDSSSMLEFDTSKDYFVAARLSFDDAQTAGLMASGVVIEATNNTVRNSVNHARLYPALLIGKTVYAYGLMRPTANKEFLRLVFEGMGTSQVNYTFTMDMFFCAEMPSGVSVKAVGEVWKKQANPISAFELSGEIESIRYPGINAELICWGDSLTVGAGGGGVNYPAVCASELGGLPLLNCGVGGENCETIAARQGGNNIVIPAGAVNGTYESLTDIFGNTVSPLLQSGGADSGSAIIINGIKCNLAYANSTYTISGYTGTALTIPTIARFAGSDFVGDVVTFFIGNNGGNFPGLEAGVDIRIAWLKSMIGHLNHERFVVLGLTTNEETSEFTINEENKMKQTFGNKYFPTRKYLIDNGLTINGITPTAQDEEDIAAGKVPTSLMSDSVHLNQYGYAAIGKMLADKIRSLGYV